jgi:hypothetical protein
MSLARADDVEGGTLNSRFSAQCYMTIEHGASSLGERFKPTAVTIARTGGDGSAVVVGPYERQTAAYADRAQRDRRQAALAAPAGCFSRNGVPGWREVACCRVQGFRGDDDLACLGLAARRNRVQATGKISTQAASCETRGGRVDSRPSIWQLVGCWCRCVPEVYTECSKHRAVLNLAQLPVAMAAHSRRPASVPSGLCVQRSICPGGGPDSE